MSPAPGSRGANRTTLVLLVLTGLIVIVQVRLVAGGSTWGDLTYHTQVAPPRLAAAELVQGGALPAWWDGSALGVPLAAEPSHAALYPPTWIAATPRGLDLSAIAHLLWAALGVAVWARRSASDAAAVVVGLLVASSGLLTAAALRGALPAIAHLPWLGVAAASLAATAASTRDARALRHARAGWTVAIGGTLGAIALTGQLGILVDAIAIACVLGARRGVGRWLIAGVACGLAIAAAQWIPAIILHLGGDTAGGEVTAIPFARLVELIVPGSFGSPDPARAVEAIAGATPQLPSLFVGAPLLALAAIKPAARRQVILGVGMFALAFVVGRGGWPAIVGAPELHLAAVAILIAAHAGTGLDAVVAGNRRAVIALGLGGVFTAIALIAVAVLRDTHPESREAIERALVEGGLGLACILAAVALAWPRMKTPRVRLTAAAASVLALVVAPSLGATPSLAPVVERSSVTEPPQWADLASDFPPPRRVYRPQFMTDAGHKPQQGGTPMSFADAIATFAGGVGARWGIDAARGEDPARPALHDRVWLAAATEGGALLDRFGIALAILPATVVAPRGMTALATRGTWSLVELPVAPPAAVVYGARYSIDPDEAIAHMFAPPGGAGMPRGTIVVRGRGDLTSDTTSPRPCKIAQWTAGDIATKCTATRAGFAVISSSAAEGWAVTVDGVPAAPVVADVMRRAVAIPAGTHDVHWSYRTPGLSLGLAVAAAGLVGLALLGVIALQRRRPKLAQLHSAK